MVSFFFILLVFFSVLMMATVLYILKTAGNWKIWVLIFAGTLIIFLDFLFIGTALYKGWPIYDTTVVVLLAAGAVAVLSNTIGVFSLRKLYLDLKIYQKELEESKALLVREGNKARNYLDIAGVIIVVLDREGNISLINRKGCEILEYSEEELIGENWFELVLPPEIVPSIKMVFSKVIAGQMENTEYFENEIITKTGERRDIAWHNSLIRSSSGKIYGTISSGEDITERRIAEAKLFDALKEREILLKELHHRTKNNMQIISAMLNLQSSKYDDQRLSEAFDEAVSRIETMSLVHEKLYSSENISRITLKDYINDLLDLLGGSFSAGGIDVTINTELESVVVSIDQAIPIGLIVNEIVTNSFKYAFRRGDGKENIISVVLTKDRDKVMLSVSDNGVGLPNGFRMEESMSMGMNTIVILGEKQLRGRAFVDRSAEEGVKWVVEFKNEDIQAV